MNYYFINNELIKSIEELRQINLTLLEVHIISIVNSYNRVGKKCELTNKQWGTECRNKRTKTLEALRNLKKYEIINVYHPKNQQSTKDANITYLHKDIKELIMTMSPADTTILNVQSGKTGLCQPVTQLTQNCQSGETGLCHRLTPNNKKIGDACSSSFSDDVQPSDIEELKKHLTGPELLDILLEGLPE